MLFVSYSSSIVEIYKPLNTKAIKNSIINIHANMNKVYIESSNKCE